MPNYISADQFTQVGIIADTRMMIVSTCTECGASKIVSTYDGSLEQWQNEHQCEKTRSTQ